MKAAKEGFLPIVQLLISKKADINKSLSNSKKKFKAIHQACKQDDVDIVKAIIDANSDLIDDAENT